MSLAPLALLVSLAAAQVPPSEPTAAPTSTPAAPTAPARPKVPRFSKMPVGACGCSLYAPPGMEYGLPTKSADGSNVWTGEVAIEGWTFGSVVVKFAEPMPAATPEELEELLVGYMAFLRGQLGIQATVGVGRGHTHSENPAARGVIDYWKDGVGDSWAVKGWVDAERLAVLFVSGKGEYPYYNAQQMFLDGFRFK